MKKIVTRWEARWMEQWGETKAKLVVVSLDFELQPTRLKIVPQSSEAAYNLSLFQTIFNLNFGHETKEAALKSVQANTVDAIKTAEARIVEYKRRLAELAKALPGDVD